MLSIILLSHEYPVIKMIIIPYYVGLLLNLYQSIQHLKTVNDWTRLLQHSYLSDALFLKGS